MSSQENKEIRERLNGLEKKFKTLFEEHNKNKNILKTLAAFSRVETCKLHDLKKILEG